ncbi:small acid-soluble spore protein SspI [Paenibacillus caui]|uniref:small acid-soluble spore protein SspI n=1 Tax=Paenibacillus caui TaxID=2873927 RepID=UPI001CA9B445|nr:small acid-soluble spore protein SspI [Paenibacillus caui]
MAVMLDLRQAVVQKMIGSDQNGLREMIEGSIGAQEAALPGLGVAFELIWKNIDQSKQNELITVLENALKSSSAAPRAK